jgi:hypothetical protein
MQFDVNKRLYEYYYVHHGCFWYGWGSLPCIVASNYHFQQTMFISNFSKIVITWNDSDVICRLGCSQSWHGITPLPPSDNKKIFQFASIYVCFVKIIIFGKTIGYSNVHYFHNGVHPPKKKGGPHWLYWKKKKHYMGHTFLLLYTTCIVHRRSW